MRVLVRKQLEVKNGVDIETLTTWQRVKVAALSLLQSITLFNTFYNSRLMKKEWERIKQQATRDDFLKRRILAEFATYFSKENDDVAAIIIAVDASYKDSLLRILGLNDDGSPSKTRSMIKAFSGYSIHLVQEQHDIRMAFDEMPYLLDCRKKVLVEV